MVVVTGCVLIVTECEVIVGGCVNTGRRAR